jgi:hypothetical protein
MKSLQREFKEPQNKFRVDCFARLLTKGINHSLPRLSCIPSRKAAIVLHGGLVQRFPKHG